MLENWLEPVNRTLLDECSRGEPSSIGRNLLIHDRKVPDLYDCRVALIGVESEPADAIRRELYAFSSTFPGTLADLGNVRSSHPDFLVPLLREMMDGDVLPILIGCSESHVSAQLSARLSVMDSANVTVVDNRIRWSEEEGTNQPPTMLNTLLQAGRSRIPLCTVIGYQRHLTSLEAMDFFESSYYEFTSLGQLREKIRVVEPALRDTNVLIIQIPAFNGVQFPARYELSPTGLSVDEGCRILRYAGLSGNLDSVSFPGMDVNMPGAQLTANAIAQMVWYFLEGLFQWKLTNPDLTEEVMEFVVALKEADMTVTFLKGLRTERWWVKIPGAGDAMYMLACSYDEYVQTSNGDFPERLLRSIERLSQ